MAEFAQYQPVFQRILEQSDFGRPQTSRRGEVEDASRIAARYKESVVSAAASLRGDDGEIVESSGSGFIIHKDGYVVTNAHVVLDQRCEKPADRIEVEWDESLGREKVTAELIGYRYIPHTQLHLGNTDVALLTLPPGNYKPVPLTPLADVQEGDEIAHGHLSRAHALRPDDDQLRKRTEELGLKPLSLPEIAVMIHDFKYHPQVVADIVQATPLDFTLDRDNERQKAFLKKYPLPLNVLAAILRTSQRVKIDRIA